MYGLPSAFNRSMIFSPAAEGIDLLTGLQAFWPFNGDSDDSSGNDNDLTIAGAAYSEGLIGNALSDQDSAVTRGLALGATFSISFWFKNDPTFAEGSTGFLIELFGTGFEKFLEVSTIADAEQTYLSYFSLEGGQITIPSDDEWHHVVLCKSGSVISIYHNNVLSGTENVVTNGMTNIRLTCGPNLSDKINYLDLVGCYNILLSQDQIDALYNSGLGIDPTA